MTPRLLTALPDLASISPLTLPRQVSVEDWLMLLMRVMIMEYNQLLFPGRFRLQWGMREELQPAEAAVHPLGGQRPVCLAGASAPLRPPQEPVESALFAPVPC